MYSLEIALSRLYALFAFKFPEEAPFWKKLSNDEIVHGDNIKRIVKLVAENDVVYEIGKSFSSKAGIALIENIKLYISDVNENFVSKEKSFNIGIELEKYLIEANYMDFLITDNKEYNDFIKVVAQETIQHKAFIEKKLRQYSSGV